MVTFPKMRSFFDRNLLLSLEKPEGWEAFHTEQFELLFLAPAEDGYRVNLGINIGLLEPPTEDELKNLLKKTSEVQAKKLNQYRQTKEVSIRIDDRPAHLRFYEWQDPGTGFNFSQLQCAILVSSDACYTYDGSCLKSLESQYIPILERIVRSLRFVNAEL